MTNELKPCRMNAGMQELLDDIDIEREINKIKADAVREAVVFLESQACTSKHDYELLNEYADKLEQGE